MFSVLQSHTSAKTASMRLAYLLKIENAQHRDCHVVLRRKKHEQLQYYMLASQCTCECTLPNINAS